MVVPTRDGLSSRRVANSLLHTYQPEFQLPKIDALLRQAQANLRTYHEVTEAAERDRWSALYLPLSLLLGSHLTKCLRVTGELQHDYRYVGQTYVGDGSRRNDHVVPMKCLIRQLIPCSREWPQGREGVACLRGFLGQHLVMANIPSILDRRLVRDAMPNSNWWRPVDAEFVDQDKQTALWGRYVSRELGLVMPWNGNQDFVRV
jgi:hypothetical protein